MCLRASLSSEIHPFFKNQLLRYQMHHITGKKYWILCTKWRAEAKAKSDCAVHLGSFGVEREAAQTLGISTREAEI